MNKEYVLGIDTSNYKTSVCLLDRQFDVLYDGRTFLDVKRGERGLRQSEALFQHIKALPHLLEEIPVDTGGALAGVFWSNRPRPVRESYMPVFMAGESIGRSIAGMEGIIGMGFSHQEGHIEAVRQNAGIPTDKEFLACHFSGGTTEILQVAPRTLGVIHNTGIFYNIEKIGGTKDISYGQVLDRAGVAMGLDFPAGEALDKMALSSSEITAFLTSIKVMNAGINLSGIDTQIKRVLQSESFETGFDPLAREIMVRLADSIVISLSQAASMTGLDTILMAGGVSSSQFIRTHLRSAKALEGIDVIFGEPSLSQDNAVGTAILGGRYLWD